MASRAIVLFLATASFRLISPTDIGGSIRSRRTLTLNESPYQVTSDLVVEREGHLIIEPGVKLLFEPGVGVTVRGIIIAQGTPNDKIVFTRKIGSIYRQPPSGTFQWPKVRLVDGNNMLEGRLQILYKDRWRSVCTNSKNWTAADLHVMCRQLGFTGGLIYRWFERNNHSSQLMYQNPNCSGEEISVFDCPNWDKRQLGSGVCDYHYDIGIQCDSTVQSTAYSYWKGISFEDAHWDTHFMSDRITSRKRSSSVLENVVITYAGRDFYENATSALQILGVPPRLRYLEIHWSAYNGINITQPTEAFDIEDSIISNNRGYGIYINSSVGVVGLQRVKVKENGGDGVRYVFHDPYVVSSEMFCGSSDLGTAQTYPIRRTYIQERHIKNAQDCKKIFQVNGTYGHTLTVHFPLIMGDEINEKYAGRIEVYDGGFQNNPLLARFSTINGTRPQSVSSSRNIILIHYHPPQESMVLFTIEITSNIGKAYDLNLTGCNISRNNGRGVLVENQRSGTLLNWTHIIENNHISGLNILDGAGDVVVNNSVISDNIGDGVNISYTGGFRHFDRSRFVNNTGYGLIFWFNETSQKIAFNFTAEISYSEISNNGLTGVFIGNICLSNSFWNISMNTFSLQMDNDIQLLSCWQKNSDKKTMIQVSHNKFEGSHRLAFHLVPALNIHAVIKHNIFTGYSRGVLLISNQRLYYLTSISAVISISYNEFTRNRGSYVCNIGLSEDSLVQELSFTKNRLVENSISEPFSLNPRSRAAAVVVVSSSNAVMYRNHLNNPLSSYELSSHLDVQSAIINASLNYWGKDRNATAVYERIFDTKDRYNLAAVEFQPFIYVDTDLDTNTLISDVDQRDTIMRFKLPNNVIGGAVIGEVFLNDGTYTVTRDIYVKPNSKLSIHPGAVLSFEQFTGLMVQGMLQSEGIPSQIIKYTMTPNKAATKYSSISLSGKTEGRLEVQVDGISGSVCTYGWDMQDAAVVCHQLGLVLNPRDWLLEKSQFTASDKPILLSNVQCTDLDTDLLNCKAENNVNDFENSCTEEVGMRCYPPSWSGLRLGMAARESIIKYTVIENAGILDYSTHAFKPALQIDFNHHKLENLLISRNSDSGLGIMWNDVFYNSDVQKVINSEMSDNNLHGIITHSQGIEIHKCVFHKNMGSGIHYNPMFTYVVQRDLISWINRKDKNLFIVIPEDISREKVFTLNNNKKFIIFREPKVFIKNEYTFYISTNPGNILGFMVLNPFSSESTEEVEIYGSRDITDNSVMWSLRKNLTSFPLRSPGYVVTIKYRPGSRPDYSAILYVTQLEGKYQKDNKIEMKISSVSISSCGKGISSNHYNSDTNIHGDHYHRYSNETILIEDSKIMNSTEESIFVWTPFWDPSESNLAEINYTLIRNSFHENSGGIVQYSRDIRNSTNLFHWTLNDSNIENNRKGGVDIRLPYVWQYSENYTHSFIMHNTVFHKNQNFTCSLSGHFARVNITDNTFTENFCKSGSLTISGMEKELLVERNRFTENQGSFVVQFNLQSHADIFGVVSANFKWNILKSNRDNKAMKVKDYEPSSYALAIRGVQQVNVTRNVLHNPNLQFEFLAGIFTGSLKNTINVTENWWGNTNFPFIQLRIFDFDDWNNFAIAKFVPFLLEDSVHAATSLAGYYNENLDTTIPFGGRVNNSLTLKARGKPYVIKSDLTILPDVNLQIDAGVTIQFYPGIGMLILGTLNAEGSPGKPIIMETFKLGSELDYKRSLSKSSSNPEVRLCIVEECKYSRRDGFLEVFNKTTLQWVPVCDQRFTERNAEVACRELGYSTFNVQLHRGHRNDIGLTSLSRVRYWPHPLECTGSEDRLLDCEHRLNGFSEHYYDCSNSDNFVYIDCGSDNLEEEERHWGGIRFSIGNFETSYDDFDRSHSYDLYASSLKHVRIEGAGILHGEKNAAIQIIFRDVSLHDVSVTKSASHGVEVIGSSSNMIFNEMNIKNNLGIGVNFLTLVGELFETSELSYEPLKFINFPYSVFGMVDICDANKEQVVSERILLYYKYDNRPVDCVKIFNSHLFQKLIGFRLLQFNLFNATNYAASPDSIRIFDGDIFNQSIPMIAELGIWNDSRKMSSEMEFFKSTDSTLSVQLHASGSSGIYGFIAEIVALPLTYHGISRGVMHNISNSVISHNILDAIAYRSAGELTPIITFRYNRIESNGKKLFGNFTSTNSSVLLDVRNAENVYIFNNLFLENQGGLHIYADSRKSVILSLNGLVTNNLFLKNQNREVLLVKGKNNYQQTEISMIRNYFSRNVSPYCNNIILSQVKSKFSENLVYSNTGLHQMVVIGFEKASISDQKCTRNSFFDNKAVQPEERSTIVANNAGQSYHNNYLVNPSNDYEVATTNKTLYPNFIKNGIKMHYNPVDATNNWWGFEKITAVQGRIKDYYDYEELLEVKFFPFYSDNSSVLSGKCAGGWQKIGSTCFMYIGGIMTYKEAKKLCQADNGSIPYIKSNHRELSNFVKEQQLYYSRNLHRFWVQSIDIPIQKCAILYRESVEEYPCNKHLPFLCERDPEIAITSQLWYQEPLAIAALSVGVIATLFTILCITFWLCKSRQRYREKLSRRNSIRASMRSNRSLTSASYGNIGYNRRLEQPTKLEITSEKKINGSIDSIEKTPSRFSCSLDDTHSYDTTETQNQPVIFDTQFNDTPLENETANAIVRPTFDLTYKNTGFIERSASREEESRDWSMGSDSTLNMKHALEQDNVGSKDDVYRSTPSMYNNTSSSSNYDTRRPLETAM